MRESLGFELERTLLDPDTGNFGGTEQDIRLSSPVRLEASIHQTSGQSANPWVQNLIDWVKNGRLHAKHTMQYIPNIQSIIGWTFSSGFVFDIMVGFFAGTRLHNLSNNENCHGYGMSEDTPCSDLYSSEQETETYIYQRALYFAIDYLFRHLLRPDRAPFVLSVMLQYLPPVAYLAYHHWQVRWERNNATPPAERYEKKAAAWFSCNNSKPQQTNTIEINAETQRINRREPSDTALYSMPLLFTLVTLWEILGSVIAANSTKAYLDEYDKNNKIYEDLANVSDEEKKFNTIRDTVARATKEGSDYLYSSDFTIQLFLAVGITALFVGFLYSLKNLEDKQELAGWYSDRNNSYIELKEGIKNYCAGKSNVMTTAKITNKTTHNDKEIQIQGNDALQIMRLIIDDEIIKWTNNWEVNFLDQSRNTIFQYNNLERRVTAREEDLESRDLSYESSDRSLSQGNQHQESTWGRPGNAIFLHGLLRETPPPTPGSEGFFTSNDGNSKERRFSPRHSPLLSPPITPTTLTMFAPQPSPEERSLNKALDYEILQDSYDNRLTEFRATTTKDHHTDTGWGFVSAFKVKDHQQNTAQHFSAWIQGIFDNQAINQVTHIQLMGPLPMSEVTAQSHVSPELKAILERRRSGESVETKEGQDHPRHESIRVNKHSHLGTVELFTLTSQESCSC